MYSRIFLCASSLTHPFVASPPRSWPAFPCYRRYPRLGGMGSARQVVVSNREELLLPGRECTSWSPTRAFVEWSIPCWRPPGSVISECQTTRSNTGAWQSSKAISILHSLCVASPLSGPYKYR
jgi:hypothetical protein